MTEMLKEPGKPTKRRGSRTLAAALVLAAVALVTGFTIVDRAGDVNPAQPDVDAPTEASGDDDSGLVITRTEHGELEERPGLAGQHTTTILIFDGDRSHSIVDGGGDRAEMIKIGDARYHRGFYTDAPRPNLDALFVLNESDSPGNELLPQIGPITNKPDSIVSLLESSDGFAERSTTESTYVYSGTFTLEALKDLGPDIVPNSLWSLVSEYKLDEVPNIIEVEAVIVDDELTKIEVLLGGETEAFGFVDTAITMRFSEFGEPQSISEPTANRVDVEAEYYSDHRGRAPGERP